MEARERSARDVVDYHHGLLPTDDNETDVGCLLSQIQNSQSTAIDS